MLQPIRHFRSCHMTRVSLTTKFYDSGFSSQRINLSPLRRDFFSIHKQGRSNKEFKMTPTIQLEDEDLCRPSVYPEGTLVIKTWGPGAARVTHLGIQRHLGALTGAAPSALQVYRAEDPYRWYVVGPPSLQLHGKTGQLREPMCYYRIEELEKETVRAAHSFVVHPSPSTRSD